MTDIDITLQPVDASDASDLPAEQLQLVREPRTTKRSKTQKRINI